MNWKQKLTSRKFWMAAATFVSMLVVALGGSEEGATQITALIMAGASVVAYIIGEGLVDAQGANTNSNDIAEATSTIIYKNDDPPDEE
ncbi:hypothetical protein LJC74_03035 [Eubacteriales bacterium OttesenSCG-928-A19]|nr:hypothetical protein [Eubacteriales bacterium OttesenSCG-928-A19]